MTEERKAKWMRTKAEKRHLRHQGLVQCVRYPVARTQPRHVTKELSPVLRVARVGAKEQL